MEYYEEETREVPVYQESNPRVILVRRIRGIAIIIEAVIMLLLIFMAYQGSIVPYRNLPEKPLLPLAPVLMVVFLMAFVMALTGLPFKLLEIKYSEDGGRKHAIAGSAGKVALSTSILALVFFLILYFVPNTDFAKDALSSTERSPSIAYGNETFRFRVQDELVMARVTSIEARVQNGVTVNISLYRKEAYESGTGANYLANAASSRNTTNLPPHDLSDPVRYPYGQYFLFVENDHTDDKTADVKYFIKRQFEPYLMYTLVLWSALFFAWEMAAGVVFMVMARKYRHSGENLPPPQGLRSPLEPRAADSADPYGGSPSTGRYVDLPPAAPGEGDEGERKPPGEYPY